MSSNISDLIYFLSENCTSSWKIHPSFVATPKVEVLSRPPLFENFVGRSALPPPYPTSRKGGVHTMYSDFGVLRVKTDDSDNLHCHTQELTLVAGILAQEAIIVFKNSNILIEMKGLPLLFLPLWKKRQLKSFWIFSISTVTYVTWRMWHSFSSFRLCNSFMKILVQVLNSAAQLILELLIIIPILKTPNLWIKNGTKTWHS